MPNSKKNKIYVIFSFISVLLFMSQYIFANNETTNIQYNDISERQVLDIFYPKEVDEKKPAVIYIHGGSYNHGDKEEFSDLNSEVFTENGYIYVGINYRLSNESLFPAALDDVKTAIRYLKLNSEKYNIDPDNIYIIGHSAGANLGSLVDLTKGLEALGDEEIKYPEVDSSIAGLIGIGGFYDLDSFLDAEGTSTSVARRIKKYYDTGQEIDKVRANNIYYIKNSQTPTLLLHGTSDRVVDKEETIKYCQAIDTRTDNENVACHIIDGLTHTYSEFLDNGKKDIIFNWLNNKISE